MEGFRHILVPLDFSELSKPTLDMAARLVADAGRVTLLHVVEWLPVVTEGAFGVYPHRKDIEQLKALSREKLESYGVSSGEMAFAHEVREGRPATTILEVAEELHPDLLVIGSHGRSVLDHFLLGSVTERVLRRAKVPVLVVRVPRTSKGAGIDSASVKGG
jgi:nucleotide-binding universal stress UspA family protein